MKKIPDYIKTISIDSEGETTKSRYIGQFKVKLVLTNSDKLKIERLYKEELPDDKGVEETRRVIAGVIAELRVRVLEGPPWWSGSREGRDMVEMQPLYDLIMSINKEYMEWLKKLNEEAEPSEENKGSNN